MGEYYCSFSGMPQCTARKEVRGIGFYLIFFYILDINIILGLFFSGIGKAVIRSEDVSFTSRPPEAAGISFALCERAFKGSFMGPFTRGLRCL